MRSTPWHKLVGRDDDILYQLFRFQVDGRNLSRLNWLKLADEIIDWISAWRFKELTNEMGGVIYYIMYTRNNLVVINQLMLCPSGSLVIRHNLPNISLQYLFYI